MLHIGKKIEIWIDRLSSGGRGVGRSDGIVIFVPDVSPQERVLVEIVTVKKNFAQAQLVRVVEPSSHRINPPCPIAGTCGGCSWQHVSYDEQLMQKQDLVSDALSKFAGLKNVEIEPTRPSPQPFRYRNRIQVHYQNGKLGFFRRGSHTIVDAADCLITQTNLTSQFAPLKERLDREKSVPRRIELMETETGQIKTSTETRYNDQVGFAQVNTAQNQNLVEYVVSQIRKDCLFLFDLYAGAGNFSLPLARSLGKQAQIHAVELHPQSIKLGRERSRSLTDEVGEIHFHEAKVEDFFATLLSRLTAPETDSQDHPQTYKNSKADWRQATVLLDPPRSGCEPSVIKSLIQLEPREIIYVSCHPVTLARDLKLLCQHYDLVRITPFDMFPHTDHVEVVATLVCQP